MMNIGTTFISDGELTKAIDPGEPAFDDPTMFTEPFRAVDPAARNPRLNPTLLALHPAARVIVAFVGMAFLRPMPRSAPLSPDVWDGIEHLR